jgi:adenine/guanine phosphoribosyltransferase-like PRPP-binding protein
VDEARVVELLGRGGGGTGEDAPGGRAAKYNGLADPAGAEELAGLLVERLHAIGPTVIVVWEDPEDVVLGHVVGRELGLPVVRAYDADGLVGHSAGLPVAPRVALVADAIRDPRVILAARAVAEREGGSLVATAALVGTQQLASVSDEAGEVIVLVETPAATAGEAG